MTQMDSGTRGLTRRRVMHWGATLTAVTGGGLALTACGASNTAPSAGTTGSGAAPATTAPATIRFHHRGGQVGVGQEPTLYAEQIPLFQAKFPNIKVIDEGFTGEDFYTKVTVLNAGGSLGDAMWTSVGGGGIYNVAAQKMITPVDPFVAKEKFDLSQYYKGTIDGLKRDGKLYGLPFKSHPGYAILYYNQTLLEQKGASVPDKAWNLDRLLDAAKRVGGAGTDTFGYFPHTSHKSILAFTRAHGGELVDPEGKKSLLNSQQAITAVNWMYETFHKHNVAPVPPLPQGGEGTMFTTGKLAMHRSGTFFQNTAVNQVKDQFKWNAIIHPKGPANVGGSDYEIDAYSIITSSKQQDAAWQWVKWITNQESGIRLGEIGGTIGGRPDVYRSERMLKDPLRRIFLEAMESAQTGRPVYNTRLSEYEKTLQDGLAPVWLGKETPNKAFLDELSRQVQVVLDQPLP